MIATPAQLLAARLLLGYKTQGNLAEKLGIKPHQVGRGERLAGAVMGQRLQAFYEASGVEFIPDDGGGPGVRLAKPAQSLRDTER